MASESLVDNMERFYVDAEGNTIAEAVDLGMANLQFLSDMHQCVELASQKNTANMMNVVCDFFISLVVENFTRESMSANSGNIASQVATIRSMDTEVGDLVQSVVNGSYAQIIDNDFFRSDTCNVILRVLIIEGVVRTCNANVFCRSPQHGNVLLTYSNMQAAYHSLAMIAFLCAADQSAYFSMNLKVEEYANEVCASMANFIHRAAKEY